MYLMCLPYCTVAPSARKEVGDVTRTAEFLRRVVAPDPAVLAQIRNPDEIATRILGGALEQFELIGIRRTTMEDVARRSGIGRASLYRRFPTKALLVDAVVLAEVRRYFDGNARARSSGATFEERLVNGTVFMVKFLREHTLLNKLMHTEPETILPGLTVDADGVLDLATDQAATLMATALCGTTTPTPAQKRHLRTVAELHTRLALSFILTPHTSINLDTIDEVRAFVYDYLVPMTTVSADNVSSA